MPQDKPKFIRKKGKIIPISSKKKGGKPVEKKKKKESVQEKSNKVARRASAGAGFTLAVSGGLVGAAATSSTKNKGRALKQAKAGRAGALLSLGLLGVAGVSQTVSNSANIAEKGFVKGSLQNLNSGLANVGSFLGGTVGAGLAVGAGGKLARAIKKSRSAPKRNRNKGKTTVARGNEGADARNVTPAQKLIPQRF